jgi:putative aminopeptidase FrvX
MLLSRPGRFDAGPGHSSQQPGGDADDRAHQHAVRRNRHPAARHHPESIADAVVAAQLDADSDAHADIQLDADQHAHRDCSAKRYADDNFHADEYSNEYTDECADRYTHVDGHEHADIDVDANVGKHFNADQHAHPNGHHRADGDGQPQPDGHAAMTTTAIDIRSLLTRLSHATGISGYESEVRALVLDEFGRFSDETRTDKVGNALAIKHGHSRRRRRRKIMLASHMDEIGLMVSDQKHGFLQVNAVGGVDPRVQPGQEVIVHGRRELPGLISSVPPHLLKPADRDKAIPIDQLWIDVGLTEAQVKRWVSIGDLVSTRREVIELKNGLLAGKAFDNRTSVVAVAVCLERLAALQHSWDVVAVATVQEEIGLRGAATSAFGVAPDIAIAIDATYGKQHGSPDAEVFPLDKGPTIGIGPNMHPKMTQRLIETAKRLELDHQIEPMPGSSGTDGWAIQVARDGIPTGVVSIPIRSMHTPVETVSPRDIERAGRLIAEFIAGLDEAFYQSLTE